MDPRARRRHAGFTLLEMLLAASIVSMIVIGLFRVFDTTTVIYNSGQGKANVQQNARVAMDQMARQIRMAGNFPENFTVPPPATALANPLPVATDSALAIYGDVDGSGASNVVLFCLNGTDLLMASAPSGSAGAYTCGAGTMLAENVTSLRFTYYDANNAPIPNPPATPFRLDDQGLGAVPDFASTTERGAVRRVVVALTTRQNIPGQGPQVYTLTSDVRLRNLN